jgi:hypothetical protein
MCTMSPGSVGETVRVPPSGALNVLMKKALAAEHRALQAGHDPAGHLGLDLDAARHAGHAPGFGLDLASRADPDLGERERRAERDLDIHAGPPAR